MTPQSLRDSWNNDLHARGAGAGDMTAQLAGLAKVLIPAS
jgi:hypothetical protein